MPTVVGCFLLGATYNISQIKGRSQSLLSVLTNFLRCSSTAFFSPRHMTASKIAGPRLAYSKMLQQILHKLRYEVPALVAVQISWDTNTEEEGGNMSIHHCLTAGLGWHFPPATWWSSPWKSGGTATSFLFQAGYCDVIANVINCTQTMSWCIKLLFLTLEPRTVSQICTTSQRRSSSVASCNCLILSSSIPKVIHGILPKSPLPCSEERLFQPPWFFHRPTPTGALTRWHREGLPLGPEGFVNTTAVSDVLSFTTLFRLSFLQHLATSSFSYPFLRAARS
jgi:hypothetical protein